MSRRIQLCWPGEEPLLPDLERLDVDALQRASIDDEVIWFVAVDDLRTALERVAVLRRQPEAVRYLQPVVLVHEQAHAPALVPQVGDAVSSRLRLWEDLETLARAVEPVHLWLRQLPPDTEADHQLSVRLLRHLASRAATAEPQASAEFPAGYIYPVLMPYFGGEEVGMLETLAFLEQQQFLTPEFVARAHHCYHCDAAFLNFEEVCVQCGSADLEMQELVHHFRCGHVAPLDEYRDGEELRCGKCGRELRHIGVDYDKPSTMYHCNDCDHRMQEADVRTTCYRCGRSASPDNQRIRRISRYHLTPLGENGARYGVASLFTNILERDVGLVPWSVFERIVDLEASRIARFGRTRSCVLLLEFTGIERIYTELGDRAAQLFEDLSEVFSQILRTTDVISTRNDTIYTVLLTETGEADAEVPRTRLLERLSSVLGANLQAPPGVEARLLRIDENLDLARELTSMVAAAS